MFAHYAPSGWNPKPRLNVAAAPRLSLWAVINVASRSMTTHPERSLPATLSHGKPCGRRASSSHTRARTFARALPIRRNAASSSPGQSQADGGFRRRISEHQGLMR